MISRIETDVIKFFKDPKAYVGIIIPYLAGAIDLLHNVAIHLSDNNPFTVGLLKTIATLTGVYIASKSVENGMILTNSIPVVTTATAAVPTPGASGVQG
jgi:hypothetical protein